MLNRLRTSFAMATLRAVPSISSLLEPSREFISSRANVSGRRTVSLNYFSNHVRLGAQIRASANAKGLIQGLRQAGRGRIPGEESSIVEAVEEVEVVEAVEGVESCEGLGVLERFVRENARELAIGSLVLALVCLPDGHALALGPGGGGPVVEEFWDNVRRYGFYFFTVVSGGLYSLAKPLLDLLKNPSTQILVLIAIVGTLYLVYLTVSTMLGLNDFVYEYAQ